MLTLCILVLLGIGFYSGARRGFALQMVYSAGYFISFLVAQSNYKKLTPQLELLIPYPAVTENSKMIFFDQETALDLDKAFYSAAAFLMILFVGWLATRFIAIFVRKLTFIPLLKQADWLFGGFMCFAVVYIGIFLILTILTYIPMDVIQNQFETSGLARGIVENTPVFTKEIHTLWVTDMIG